MSDAQAEVRYQAKQTRRTIAGIGLAVISIALFLAALFISVASTQLILLALSVFYMIGVWGLSYDGYVRAAWNRVPGIEIESLDRGKLGDSP